MIRVALLLLFYVMQTDIVSLLRHEDLTGNFIRGRINNIFLFQALKTHLFITNKIQYNGAYKKQTDKNNIE